MFSIHTQPWRLFRRCVLALAGCALLLAAGNLAWTGAQAQATQPNDGTLFALTANGNLIAFNAQTPGTLTRNLTVTGLGAGESLVGIDFRPANNQLYAVSSASRIYTLNTTTGAATVVGTTAFTPALNGTRFGMDFNPVPDRIRLVSDAEQNLRLHPDTGAVAGTDSALVYAQGDANASANPNVAAVGYTNNFRGATTTTLYGIDSNLDTLVRQGSLGGAPVSPNSGQLFTVGALGVNTTDQVGFDILAPGDTALASLTAQGAANSSLYFINLLSGTATLIGQIGGNAVIRDLAVPANYAPTLQQVGVVAVNSASFDIDALTPEMLTTFFGAFQTQNNQSFTANGLPLPTTLGGVRVTVNGTEAGLFFVSPTQLNCMVPANVADGVATVTVTNADGSTRTGTVTIKRASPGLLTQNASGRGTVVGLTTFDGATYEPLVNPNGTERPVNPGTAARPNYIIIFGTGLRNTPADNPNDANGVAEAVSVTIQGVPATVAFAGQSPSFAGLDQANVIIPPQLAGAGQVTLRLMANGVASNAVTFTLGGTPPAMTTQDVALGQSVAGALAASDQITRAGNETGNTYFFDAYRFGGFAGQPVAIEARSTVFDVAVLLYKRNADGSLRWVAANEDLGGLGDGAFVNGNALLLTTLPEGGDYVVLVTSDESSPSATGAYTLRLAGNVLSPLAFGQTVNGSIAATDWQTAAGVALDAYVFSGVQGEQVQLRVNSTAFDAAVLLLGADGKFVAADDNSGGGQNALLAQMLPATGNYIVVVTPFAPGRTGDYSLTLTRGTSPATPLALVEVNPFALNRWAENESLIEDATNAVANAAARRVVVRD